MVPRRGLEPPCLSTTASKTVAYTVPPPGQSFIAVYFCVLSTSYTPTALNMNQ